MRKIAILGSTGSIGTQALEVIRRQGGREVAALAAMKNIDRLEEQLREFSPRLVCVYDEAAAKELAARAADTGVKVVSGMDGLIEAATMADVDMVLVSVVGMIGIRPTLAAIEAGKDIALANKETLVTAGHPIIPAVRERGVGLYPVDSEHSAIFQVLKGQQPQHVDSIWITASGGPFRGRKKEELADVTPEEALRHPNWSMGPKITIDSSTMVNKGLEVMEAHWLFDMPYERIHVVIQPQSIIHSMVQMKDGALLAQLGTSDMKLPIQYALYYPDRLPLADNALDLYALGQILLAQPDDENFPALPLAYRAGETGGTMPVVYNAANEWAVARFLSRQLTYPAITETIERAMEHHLPYLKNDPSLEEILAAERETYDYLEGGI